MKFVLTILFISLFYSGSIRAHPLHVSLTSIAFNTVDKEALIVYKFYTDDFSLLFFHLYEKQVIPQSGKAFTDKELDLINGYLANAFSLTFKGDKLPFTFVKKEQNEESIWLYYACTLPRNKFKTMLLTNKLLLDLFEDQTNLVIINDGKSEKGISCNAQIRESAIDFRHQ